LHLFPGILTGIVFVLIAPVVRGWKLPPLMALCLADLAVFVPLVLGYLGYQSYKVNGRLSLDNVIVYRTPVPWVSYLWLVPLVVVAAGLIFRLLAPVTDWLFTSAFGWFPRAAILDDPTQYPRSVQIITYVVFFLTVVLTASILEEVYFRGHLLPRLAPDRAWSPLLHGFLFALHHAWTPWYLITRTIAILPLVGAVRWKRNIYIGAAAHVLGNSIDLIMWLTVMLRRP
jgi:membrane protease YdiL (CAAX protease family)